MAFANKTSNQAVRDALITMGFIQPGQQIDLSGAQNGFFKNGLMSGLGITQEQFDAAKTLARWDGDVNDSGHIMDVMSGAGIKLQSTTDVTNLRGSFQGVQFGNPPQPVPGTSVVPPGGLSGGGEVAPAPPPPEQTHTYSPGIPAAQAQPGGARAPGKAAGAGGGPTDPHAGMVQDEGGNWVRPLGAGADTAAVDAFVKQHFGSEAWAIGNPELHGFLHDIASTPDLSVQQIAARLGNTQWWQHTAEPTRKFTIKAGQDASTLNGIIDRGAQSLVAQAAKDGFTLDYQRAVGIVTTGLKQGWDGNDVDNLAAGGSLNVSGPQFASSLGDEYAAGGANASMTGAYSESIRKQMADSYIPVSDGLVQSFTKQFINDPDGGQNALNGYIQDMAGKMYPGLAEGIKAGHTVRDLIHPYAALGSQLLEVGEDKLDFSPNSPLNKILDTVDPKTGQHGTMNYADASQALRSDPRWMQTDNARQTYMKAGNDIMKGMGFH